MEYRAFLFIPALLLGLSQALHLNQTEHVDMTTRILTINNGSTELLFEGDIILPTNRNAMNCSDNSCLWKKSSNGLVEIPYTLSSVFTSSDRTTIVNAMDMFHSKTCIRFVPRTNQDDYLKIESDTGCYSYLGKLRGGQVVSLSRMGCVYNSIVQHELTHALGFFHEHTRSDRDKYVTINWKNIKPNMRFNFNIKDTNNLNMPYDYTSVMHYGKDAFSINGLDTITPIPDPSIQIGLGKSMTATDILKINILYSC